MASDNSNGQPDSNSDWKIPEKFIEIVTIKEAVYIYEQGLKSFDMTIETSKLIVERTYNLLTVITGILIGLVSFAISRIENDKLDILFFTTLFAILYYLYIGFNFILKNIKPTEYKLPGTQPKKYFVEYFFAEPSKQSERVKNMYLAEIQTLQNKITKNQKVNKDRWDLYKKSINQVFYSPIIVILFFGLLKLTISVL